MEGDHEVLKQMSQKPRIVPENSQMKLRTLMKEIHSINAAHDLVKHMLERDLDQQAK